MPLIMFVLLCILPLIGLSSYVMHILVLVIMWSVIGMGWNLLGGYCGQVSFGHAAFFGMGAYTAGLVYYHLGISAWWGLLVSIPVLTVSSLVIGFICLRLRGAYFALATLALGEVLRVTTANPATAVGNGRSYPLGQAGTSARRCSDTHKFRRRST